VAPEEAVAHALEQMEACGVLLLADARLPSLSTLVAGEPVRGSWWGHPKGKAIYAACQVLEHHNDVMVAKLIAGKVTFVHRRRWGELFAIGMQDAAWKRSGLSPAALRLLDQVEESTSIRLDQLPLRGQTRKELSAAARELETRLLLHGVNIHTDTGAHAKVLETWGVCRRRHRFNNQLPALEEAQRWLEELSVDWQTRFGTTVDLGWSR